MKLRIVTRGGVALAMALLAGCGGGEPRLMSFSGSGSGPDEFAILPGKPLELPPPAAPLPVPVPGGANLADPTPQADAVAALGGSRAALAGGAITDQALIAHAGRNGIDGNIRGELASRDLDYRRRNDGRLLERLFGVNVYLRAYEPQSLDQYGELERLRASGIRTPAAPPPSAAR
ncbi:DUF3035 domain-containing protein [Profundibacterium mesophilum]|uniref:DUF3035 domain-containing protein n=1 Tax=Profundibacterium mesophilum KAUST100406-0324 TaxID=1037889 RepID=A0A921NRW2_9RHOB|nr:DUF3035 domain-containing protein [Profundibacterium mesophilum]KAF0676577.1 hypothetical protein PMES_01309 [Profundibacterium mesophilum KAUST100406-0324]